MIKLELPQNKSPYFYAAAEEWLVRNLSVDSDTYILLYVNEPCVVVGKNQCVWKELNWNYLKSPENIVVRRVSGGGTVWHDYGNLCFSFIAKFENERINNYKWFNKPVIDALEKMGINAAFSERNDILFEGKKISGNAQFTNRNNILSHGTILFDAELDKLRAALSKNDFEVKSKAVSSVRSTVMNLKEQLNLSFTKFCSEFETFLPISSAQKLDENMIAEIEKLAEEKYHTFDWIFAKSPAAHVHKNNVSFTIENGLLQNVQSDFSDLKELEKTTFYPDFLVAKMNELKFSENLKRRVIELLF